MNIDKYQELSFKYPDCNNKWKEINEINEEEIRQDIQDIMIKYIATLDKTSLKHIYALLKEKELFVKCENKEVQDDTTTFTRGRVVMINPGSDRIGREQRYIHPYIILGEFKETVIAVPITNMAFNKKTQKYYLRNPYEVELKNPDTKKKYTEYRTKKRSVADIRNICGFDKRRIVDSQLNHDIKFAPKEYMNDISENIIKNLAIIQE